MNIVRTLIRSSILVWDRKNSRSFSAYYIYDTFWRIAIYPLSWSLYEILLFLWYHRHRIYWYGVMSPVRNLEGNSLQVVEGNIMFVLPCSPNWYSCKVTILSPMYYACISRTISQRMRTVITSLLYSLSLSPSKEKTKFNSTNYQQSASNTMKDYV